MYDTFLLFIFISAYVLVYMRIKNLLNKSAIVFDKCMLQNMVFVLTVTDSFFSFLQKKQCLLYGKKHIIRRKFNLNSIILKSHRYK